MIKYLEQFLHMCIIILLSLFGNGAIGWCTCFADLSTSISLEFVGGGAELDGVDV